MAVPGTAANAAISCSITISTVPGTGPRFRDELSDGTPDQHAPSLRMSCDRISLLSSIRHRYNRSVASENKLIILILAALVALVAAPLIYWKVRDVRRPVLVNVRIVTASDSDPVFRTGPRRSGPTDPVRVAAALELQYPGGRRQWLAPVERLEIDGRIVDHLRSEEWPENDRTVRAFWFTVESTNIGGLVAPDNAAKRLRYRPFLAPEMGQGLSAVSPPEVHHDDGLGPQPDQLWVDIGTLRLYVKVDVLQPDRSNVQAVQTMSSRGADRILDPDYPAILIAASVPAPLDATLGELFNLPGWETDPDDPRLQDEIAEIAFGSTFSEAVDRRLLTSSRSFAAVAVSGRSVIPDSSLQPLGDVTLSFGDAMGSNRPLRWGDDVLAGDLLVDGSHFTVLVEDDGNGRLDRADIVAHCWQRPPAVSPLGLVYPDEHVRLGHFRHAP